MKALGRFGSLMDTDEVLLLENLMYLTLPRRTGACTGVCTGAGTGLHSAMGKLVSASNERINLKVIN
jgi:hypothetical protein